MRFLLLSVLVITLASTSFAMYVDLNEATQWCFNEEVPKDTLVLSKWKCTPSDTIAPDSRASLGIKLVISDPTHVEFFDKDFGLESRFAFTSAQGGEYRLCFATNTSTWFGTGQALKFEVTIDHGVDATDYEQIAKTEHLSMVELSIRKLNDRVRLIRAEQDYQRRRETMFRNTSEATNSRVLWWSIAQIGVLFTVGLWQMRHLKGFFSAKKLV